MPHAALEGAAPIPAVFVREEFKVVDRRYMEDCGDRLFLLALVRNASVNRLDCGNVRPAEFEVGCWLPVYDDYRQPWMILSVRHQPIAGLAL